MPKKLLISDRFKIEETLNYVDGYIFGFNDFSVNFPYNLTMEELIKINDVCKKNDKDLFISLNKNIHSKEIDKLKEILVKIDKLDIKGILYADTSLVVLKEELNLKTDLVWSSEHLTTNYSTINYWNDFKVNYTFLSCEITESEIKEIINNTKSKLMVQVFGYFPIFTSIRFAISNYLNYFNIKDNSKNYYIEKEGKKYPIIETKEGTVVYSNYILLIQ